MHTITVATAQGSRTHQEDRMVNTLIDLPGVSNGSGCLMAVFDGHRGAATAEKASQTLPDRFASVLKSQKGNVIEALRDTMHALAELTRKEVAGSTASIVYIPDEGRRAYAAVLGDSPVAFLDSGDQLHIGPDHNVRTNPAERLAAETRGAVYSGGYVEDSEAPGTGLQMSRSLGDVDLDRILNREPEVYSVALGKKSLLVLGTDGLLEPYAGPLHQQMKRLVEMVRQGADAQMIVDDAIRRDTGDNVTAIVWTA
jgi:serine/threonine protein phosphatase PrpC